MLNADIPNGSAQSMLIECSMLTEESLTIYLSLNAIFMVYQHHRKVGDEIRFVQA